MYQAKSAENQVKCGLQFNTEPDGECEVSFCSNKKAYPGKPCNISLLIL